ncbi:hypothetical protein CRE_04965 [Caenorhabditis remanei]|uniref:Rhodanese domain-containing protein n=1 Tax=Caenorhabditis remanei TaxID=31234 RepID=E3MN74_CAERE|nr:hypothetical protein CRE_04965 [Caenorhabditis remanei]
MISIFKRCVLFSPCTLTLLSVILLINNQVFASSHPVSPDFRAMSTNSLVTPQWLIQNLNKVRVIDATYMPADAYAAEHIPGAAHYAFDSAYFKSEYIKFDLYPPEWLSTVEDLPLE